MSESLTAEPINLGGQLRPEAWETDVPVPKISIRRLDAHYPGKCFALKQINLDIPEGSLTTFIGGSGCGKSTILRVLSRLHDHYPGRTMEGEVLLDGKTILGADINLEELRRRMPMVLQRTDPFPMSISKSLEFAINLSQWRKPEHETVLFRHLPWRRFLNGQKLPKSEMDGRVEDILIKVGLWNAVASKLNKPCKALSGGEQQRLDIARALVMKPEVVLLDEITSALDPGSVARVEDLIEALVRDGQTTLMVTHNMEQARRLGSGKTAQTVYMDGGEIVESGLTREMFQRPKNRRTKYFIEGRKPA